MRRLVTPVALAIAPVLAAGCAAHREQAPAGTLAELRKVDPDLQEVSVEQGLDQAMQGYRRFLEETPETAMTPEAMRRLADLQIEKQFGIHDGAARPQDATVSLVDAAGKPRGMAAPQPAAAPAESTEPLVEVSGSALESESAFEQRTTAERGLLAALGIAWPAGAPPLSEAEPAGPLEAIALYDRLLNEYPGYAHNDQVLYQKARAYDELGRTEEALATMEQLIRANPQSEHYDEVQFRRGEFFFTRRRFHDAESAYSAIIGMGPVSSYYELALYKLGWTLYKQEHYEEALHRYLALLDYKVSVGYDFDAVHAEDDEKRVADTYRVISLSFSNLGGPEAVQEYFATFGNRSYEDRVYANLGEHYLGKLRYDDAAKTYRAFVTLYPFHREAPRFGMRVIETFTQGGFPKLVLEAKREFAAAYGLQSEYWRHFEPAESPEVLAYLKTNLKDLATHYHAEYQSAPEGDEKLANYREALRWYGGYLESFPTDAESPGINYRFADLLLENRDFGEAARQYERTAYEYPAHEQSAAAGYAAVYAWREQLDVALKGSDEAQRDTVKRDTVASSIRFVDAFPEHEHAAAILGAAADDLYEMKNYPDAIASAQRLVDAYPAAEAPLRGSAWLVVAHGSFELADYPRAENAYAQVLAVTPDGEPSRAALVNNLAASIYRQGEIARDAKDFRAAADHFLRIRSAAPTSTIRPAAEYDAGSALMQLQDWAGAAAVLEAFRTSWPEHELQREATRQIAYAYREGGQLSRAAGEYDRLAAQAEDPAVRQEALLVSGDLYAQSAVPDRALDAYVRYVNEFPKPIEAALETRSKIAEIHKGRRDEPLYRRELAEIVRIDAEAGPERTARTRTLAARSALVLAEETFREFAAVKLRQPFEVSLQEKKQRMDGTIQVMDRLVEYELADVTAAATFYMAETYLDFSRSLAASERPADLEPADREEYEKVLEKEAAPFAEKAIALHEKNLESYQAGVVNAWTEKSFGKLVELMPVRYARIEMSSGFVGAIDSYVYRSPVSEVYGPPMPPPMPMNSAVTAAPGGPLQATNSGPKPVHD